MRERIGWQVVLLISDQGGKAYPIIADVSKAGVFTEIGPIRIPVMGNDIFILVILVLLLQKLVSCCQSITLRLLNNNHLMNFKLWQSERDVSVCILYRDILACI